MCLREDAVTQTRIRLEGLSTPEARKLNLLIWNQTSQHTRVSTPGGSNQFSRPWVAQERISQYSARDCEARFTTHANTPVYFTILTQSSATLAE